MKIKLLDKNRILDEMNNLTIMKAVKINIKLILMLLIPITMLPSYIIFCIIEKLFNINNTVFETLTYLSIYLIFILLSFNLVYLIEKSDLSDQLENLKDDLNEPYVDPNDIEKVYLLHELIKKYDLKKIEKDCNYDVNYKINFILNTDIKYENFENVNYTDSDLKNILKYKVVPQKELTQQQVKQFFNDEVEPILNLNKKSFEEKEVLLKRVINKNKVNLL